VNSVHLFWRCFRRSVILRPIAHFAGINDRDTRFVQTQPVISPSELRRHFWRSPVVGDPVMLFLY
ncbi:hypothetical protein ACUWC1_29900, partial [Klebsiella pneumoniae]